MVQSRFLTVVLWLVVLSLRAQEGNFYLSHYVPNEEWSGGHTFSIVQDKKGVIYFANNNGLLEFDGRNWSMTQTPGPVFTVVSNGDLVFAGGYRGFGKISVGPDHAKIYQSLTEGVANSDQIISGLALQNKIYFCNSRNIFEYSIANEKIENIIPVSNSHSEWSGLFQIGNTVFAKSVGEIFKIENGKASAANLALREGEVIEFTSMWSGKTALLSSTNRLLVTENNSLREIILKDEVSIAHYQPSDLAWVSESLIAIGTLTNGIYFIDTSTGETKEISNFLTGLPDNEVFALSNDSHQGLWVAHAYGFTRITPFLPFHSFSHYPGLAGNLLSVKSFQGITYVGTTLGLFALVAKETEHSLGQNFDATPGSESSGLLSVLKRKSKREKIQDEKKSTGVKTLKLSGYAFEKVAGIDSKVTQMIECNGQLLVTGSFGIASVKNQTTKILWSTSVKTIFMSPALNQLIASTTTDAVKTFSFEQVLAETHLLDTLNADVSYIFEDRLQNIWLCGRTKITKVETVDAAISSVEEIPFVNPTVEESVGLAYGSEVYVAAAGSFNRYNIRKNTFEKYDSFPGPKKYFASAGYFWFNDGHRWRTVDPRMQSQLKLEWLGLFQNLRYISPADNGEALWIITASNELYKFTPKKADATKIGYPLFLKEVRGQKNKLAPTGTVRISQLESTVQFEFVQPDYLGMHAVEYRYNVRGLGKDWTAWSSENNIVNFSYLPNGRYKLEIQTRDLMGKVSQIQQIDLIVTPPYWKQWWFYLLEMVFFALLVFMSMKLSGGNPKYRVVSQVLSLLTVIMLIQLLQTIVNSFITVKTTPVLDFFLQVAMALLILPLENILRKFIMRKEKPFINFNEEFFKKYWSSRFISKN